MASAPQAGPALGFLELSSIARGPVVVDAMVKRAAVRVMVHDAISGGKLIILAEGDVADMEEGMAAAEEAASGVLLDLLFLPYAHAGLWRCLARGHQPPGTTDAIGMVETTVVGATLRGADAAAKAADVELLEVRLGRGIGGKGTFSLTGGLEDVQAALEAVRGVVSADKLVAAELVARPHSDLSAGLYWPQR